MLMSSLCRSPSPSLVVLLCIMNDEKNWIALTLLPGHICVLSLPLVSFVLALNSTLSSGFSSKVVVFPGVSLGSDAFHDPCFLVCCISCYRKNLLRMLSKPMEREETQSSLKYGRPPWVFKGSAVYQLHLVKAETARAFIPKELRLVEAFGYTLGGFFLASYDDSPSGTFDELVVIAGIVWNPPTSCAWAASVLVNSCEACAHGRKDVGLPSQVARFSKTITAIPKSSKDKRNGFLDMVGAFTSQSPKSCMDVQVSEIKGQTSMNICNINFSAAELDSSKWMGPSIKMSLPSFSGRTKYNPHLLKYSCQIECRVRAVSPAKVSGPHAVDSEEENHSGFESSASNFENGENKQNKRSLYLSVMLSKPILALRFNSLKMKVEAPTAVTKHSQSSLRQ